MNAAGKARLAYASAAPAVGPPSCSGPGIAILFLSKLIRSCLSSLTEFLPSDLAKNGLEGFTTKNAIAAAADSSVPAIVKRTDLRKRFWPNECGVFIFVGFRG